MPRVSVIIPVHDVKRYLAACLESVAAQTWHDLEAVVVDDGSSDGGAAVARGHAERDPRFRLVRQAGAGLGAARNTGLRHAGGEFVCFLDGDDLLPLHAVEYLLAELRRTGSDLATGDVRRFNPRGARPSAMHREIFTGPAPATHVSARPALLKDRLVTNKMWRRSFWDARGLRFPEGVLYEDISVALTGHFLARSVDVLPAPVHLWRERDGAGPSITQDKNHVRGLEDRFAAVTSVRRFLAAHGLEEHIPAWDQVVLDHDMVNFLDVVDTASDAFRARFLDLAGAYLDRVAPSVTEALPAARRLRWHLVGERRLDDLIALMEWERRARPGRQVVRRLGRHYLDTPLLARRDIPAEVSRLRGELSPVTRVDRVAWEEDRLAVEGRVTLRHLRPTRRFHQQVFATLVQEGTGRRVRVPAAVTRTAISARRGRPRGRRDWGGFRLVVDPRRLADASEGGALWRFELHVVHRGLMRRGPLADPGASFADQAGARSLEPALPGHYVTPTLTDAGALALRVECEAVRVTGHAVRDGRLHLRGEVVGELGPQPVLRFTREPGGVPLAVPVSTDGRTFEVEVDPAALLPARRFGLGGVEAGLLDLPVRWRVTVDRAGGAVTPVTVAEDLSPRRFGRGDREIVVLRDPSGELVLRDQAAAAYAEYAEWLAGGELLVEGGFAEPQEGPRALVVASPDRSVERLVPLDGTGARFGGLLAPEAVDTPAGPLPLPKGRYGLAVRAGGRDLPLEFEPDFPPVLETARRRFELAADDAGHAVLTVGGDLAASERGRKAQRVLRLEAYPAMRERPLRAEVFFSSHAGRRFSGSPRAVYEELRDRGADLAFLWNVRDGQVALPPGVEPVRTAGREYYEALARCRYVVVDDHLPPWFEPRAGQTVLQTRHGCVPTRVEREAGRWTHLLSPGPRCTPLLREAFGFQGEIVETGLPRNDFLSAPGRDAVAAETARALGLPEGRKVVLYVPARRAAREKTRLDLERMRAALGDDHVVLVRRHPSLAAQAPVTAPGDFVRDVSVHPDVRELYPLADVLVTDYSSAMFDFAPTGRPMLFFAYDVDEWAGRFPFDYAAEVPGPLLATADEVAEAVANAGEVAAKYTDARREFVAKFCPLDDGQAARRVVDRIFGAAADRT
ncbi:bifunctional glycosyltransferase/CDP-glycerol:glycerophosphate glycerophosphotransferase [Microtetraspora niveoalba]|uniref:bifunctional glycosyltransferase/CDP-glycerol:glycerophosphate glycerophosphotransferase n=1 Tax=Microtetraspora niveoalba TaxID=46175 RepID=UPI00082B69E9|nr:CDP-glycerol glycerophosphotransferase family protein [Microtetraspora niveoalba]